MTPPFNPENAPPLQTLITNSTQKETTVKLPNGCCNNTDCSLNIYYILLIEELSKE